MEKRNAVLLYSDRWEDWPYPPECPFKTERAFHLRKTLASMGLLAGQGRREVAPPAADRDLLETFHAAEYLDALLESGAGRWTHEALSMGIGGPDTPVFKGMYEYGALAAGASVYGADLLLSGDADIVFNPSGGLHHAGPARASGFCYINDVAIACQYLASKDKRVLYLDVDVHHGDGVQDAFYDQNNVMTISLHETGRALFPGTGFENEIGTGEGEGYAVNIPLPPGTFNEPYLRCFEEIVVPLIGAYNPDIMVLELGADALAGDPLAHLKLTNTTYKTILQRLLEFEKPLLMTGGGGYNVDNTVRAWAFAWSVVNGDHDDMESMNFGLGGVMLESTDWMAGLQDRELPVSEEQKQSVEPLVDKAIARIKELVFPFHGLNRQD